VRTSWLGGRGSYRTSVSSRGPVPESRKVRTSQSRVIANSNPRRLAGKCHRKQTATLVVVRVKRCGKSAPASRVTGVARQTPPEARSRRPHRKVRPRRRLRVARPSLRVGRLRHPATVCPDGWSPPCRRWLRRGGGEQNPAYRPTRPPYVCDLHIQLVGAASIRSASAVNPSTESIASRVRSSESGHRWL
jgi:hypothetical protein